MKRVKKAIKNARPTNPLVDKRDPKKAKPDKQDKPKPDRTREHHERESRRQVADKPPI